VSARTLILALALALATPAHAQFAHAFKLFDAQGREVGTARTKMVGGGSGLSYKTTLVRSDTLGSLLAHHTLKGHFQVERYKRRPPGIGARSSVLVWRYGKTLRLADKNGDTSKWRKLGVGPDVLVVDSRDPGDYLLVTRKYGEAGGAVFVLDKGAQATATVTPGERITRRVGGRTVSVASTRVDLGGTVGHLLTDASGNLAGVVFHDVLALNDARAKAIAEEEKAAALPPPEEEGNGDHAVPVPAPAQDFGP